MFSKDADQAKPMDKAAEQAASPAQAQPEAKPAEQAAPAMVTPTLSAEDAAVADRLRDLVETKLQQYVPREQDRAGVLAFYRARNFAPIWIASGKPRRAPSEAAASCAGVAADGLDPADYPTPGFGNADPAKLAADELALTNSVVTFARHASIGRVAFTRVSGAVYYDQKAPNAADVLGKLADSTDVARHARCVQSAGAGLQGAQGAARRGPQRQERRARKAELRARRPRPTIIKKGKAKSKKGQPSRPRPTRSSRRPRAPTPSSPTWSAGAGCRTTSARPM